MTPLSDNLAGRQVYLILHHSCQPSCAVVINWRSSQLCVGVAVLWGAQMIENTFVIGGYSSLVCPVRGHFLPCCSPLASWAPGDMCVLANHRWALSRSAVWSSGHPGLIQTDSICLPQCLASCRNQTCQDTFSSCVSPGWSLTHHLNHRISAV